MEKSPDNAVMRLNLRAALYARENAKSARDAANAILNDNPVLIEKRDGDLLQVQILMARKDLEEATLHERRGDSFFVRKIYEEDIEEYGKAVAVDRYNVSVMIHLYLFDH